MDLLVSAVSLKLSENVDIRDLHDNIDFWVYSFEFLIFDFDFGLCFMKASRKNVLCLN